MIEKQPVKQTPKGKGLFSRFFGSNKDKSNKKKDTGSIAIRTDDDLENAEAPAFL